MGLFDIWNEAYETYVDGDYCESLLQDFLNEHVEAGDITEGDADRIAEDIIETANL